MIITRYLARHIVQGSALVLLILVSLSLFFALIGELDDVGRGHYGLTQMFQYLGLRIPTYFVDYMPIAVLIGSILSLGALAGQSELIAMQASGLSIRRLILSVAVSVAMLAVFSFLVANLLVPSTEAQAKQIRSSTIAGNVSSQSRRGVWIKDNEQLVFIERLYPNGSAENIEILSIDRQGQLQRAVHASTATITDQGWLLEDIRTTELSTTDAQVYSKNTMVYEGSLTDSLLASLALESHQMSLGELYSYIGFLEQNQLDYQSAALRFWQKLYAPLVVIIMGLLAIPFVLGSQRQKNTGQRIMTGMLLGLLYVVLSRLLMQLGEQLGLVAYVNALVPSLLFMALTVWLIRFKTRI